MENNENNEKSTEEDIKDKATKIINDVKDDSESFEKKDIQEGQGMSILCYLGILVLIPYFSDKNKYVEYHAKQGLNLFIWEIIGAVVVGIVNRFLWRLWFVSELVDLVYGLTVLALSLIGIVNVVNGKAKEIPVVNKIKFVR